MRALGAAPASTGCSGAAAQRAPLEIARRARRRPSKAPSAAGPAPASYRGPRETTGGAWEALGACGQACSDLPPPLLSPLHGGPRSHARAPRRREHACRHRKEPPRARGGGGSAGPTLARFFAWGCFTSGPSPSASPVLYSAAFDRGLAAVLPASDSGSRRKGAKLGPRRCGCSAACLLMQEQTPAFVTASRERGPGTRSPDGQRGRREQKNGQCCFAQAACRASPVSVTCQRHASAVCHIDSPPQPLYPDSERLPPGPAAPPEPPDARI